MLVSVIIPVLDDAAALGELLRHLPVDPRLEIVVVDGAADARLDDLARGRADMRILHGSAGRATQMNAGARMARGRWLLFLHADSTLPRGWLDVFEQTIGQGDGGWFEFALDHPSWRARLIEWGVRWRVRLLGLAYGDQGLFVTRGMFDTLGGYREIPLMEDVDFVSRLRAKARIVRVPIAIRTSARRWERDGWVARSARNMTLLMLYLAGVSPARLARWYG
jgi:rSAM/selenodomain-associated transferase 2